VWVSILNAELKMSLSNESIVVILLVGLIACGDRSGDDL
jgi:hypothetical protein